VTRSGAERIWRKLKAQKLPRFPQNDLLREKRAPLSRSEEKQRVEVLLELLRLDREKKYLVEQLDKRKLCRKVLLERLNQVPERN
jgi:hypothetical protein